VEVIEWTHGGFMRRLFKRGKAPKQNDDATEMEIARKAAEASDNMKPIELVSISLNLFKEKNRLMKFVECRYFHVGQIVLHCANHSWS
jgi:hypothetical protein